MNNSLGGRQYAIIVLTLVTAAIHFFLGISSLPDSFGYVFILNGIAYLALIIALYFIPQLAPQRGLIRWLLLAFASVTFILYFVFNWPDVWNPLGILDKSVELILIVLLFLDRNS